MKAVKLKVVPRKPRIYVCVMFLTDVNRMVQYVLVCLNEYGDFRPISTFCPFLIIEGDFEMFSIVTKSNKST